MLIPSDTSIAVEFSVSVAEYMDTPAEALVHEIKGAIHLLDEDGEREALGRLDAYLFNIGELAYADLDLFEAYDDRSQHLAEAYSKIFTPTGRPRAPAARKAGFNYPEEIEWHLHANTLFIEPQARGHRFGVKALRLLRQYARRPGLIVTARAFPEEPDRVGVRRPSAPEMVALARYYLASPQLDLRPIGKVAEGWLVANWSDEPSAS
jgi:GNAT superfamily N-acetyltransferase